MLTLSLRNMDNSIYFDTFKELADTLVNQQIKNLNPSLDGGIFCKSCKCIHGRCIDAIFAFSVAYRYFKDDKYIDAIRGLLDYSKNLLCDDGALYNDLQTDWRYTTVFHEIDIIETLNLFESILPIDIVSILKDRAEKHANWLYLNLDENSNAVINYPANNALALFLAGSYFHKEEYISKAFSLAEYVLKHISISKLIYGEAMPHNLKTKRGCNAIDFGYNLEETLPALVRYAYLSKNNEMLDKLYDIALAHLDFILPDGAIDNSFGCRNYKWTYYGSRTCDGILPLCVIFGKRNPIFYEVAYRNTNLIRHCMFDGSLYGGPMYHIHHESPCIHQSFEHINSLAYALIHLDEIIRNKSVSIYSDSIYNKYYPEFDSYRIGKEEYLLDITCYDCNIPYSGHASGATLSMLYSRSLGPIVMGGVTEYKLTEATNMQVPLNTKEHRSLLPRFEIELDHKLYSSAYFTETKKTGELKFLSGLMDRNGELLDNSNFEINYELLDDRIIIKIEKYKLLTPFIFPMISGTIKINKGKLLSQDKIFFLTPGFIATEYKIEPDNQQIEFEVIVK